MTYIDLINDFWTAAAVNPFSQGQVSLYFVLLHICNKGRWPEWFQVSNPVLTVLSGLSRSGILRAREELRQRGLIDYRENGTKATSYHLVGIQAGEHPESTMSKSTQVGVQDSTQAGVHPEGTMSKSTQVSVQDSTQAGEHPEGAMSKSTQVGVQDSTQAGVHPEGTMSKSTQVSVQGSTQAGVHPEGTMSKSTQVSVQDSTQAESAIPCSDWACGPLKTKDKRHREIYPPLSPTEGFDAFWEVFPKHTPNRQGAESAYRRVLRENSHLTDHALVCAARNYAEEVRQQGREEQFVRNAWSFLTRNFFARYLDGEYRCPKAAKQSANRGIVRQDYDIAALEAALVENY